VQIGHVRTNLAVGEGAAVQNFGLRRRPGLQLSISFDNGAAVSPSIRPTSSSPGANDWLGHFVNNVPFVPNVRNVLSLYRRRPF